MFFGLYFKKEVPVLGENVFFYSIGLETNESTSYLTNLDAQNSFLTFILSYNDPKCNKQPIKFKMAALPTVAAKVRNGKKVIKRNG